MSGTDTSYEHHTPDDDGDSRLQSGAGHAHGHSHTHGPVAPASRHAIMVALGALIPAALVTIIGLIVMWPGEPNNVEPWTGAPHAEGTVVTVREQPCQAVSEDDPATPRGQDRRCGDVLVRLDTGIDQGKQVATEMPSGQGAPAVSAGDKVVLIYMENFDDPEAGPVYSIIDHERSNALWALVLAFVLAVVAFGRWRGVRALVGLVFTFAVLLMFIVPAILDGSPPLLVAVFGASAIMLVVLFLTHGFNLPTSMAVLGVLASLALTGVLAAVSTSLLHLTGISSEEASFFSMQFGNVNMLGLLLAGILIGALGVLDDVAVTQAYTVTELAQANPTLGFGRLYRAASRIGRAHITSVINTIVLAYAGASLPVLLLITAGGAPLGEMVTSEWLTQEIVRSIVGTLGLIAAVPITTALTALIAVRSAGGTENKAPKRTVPSHRRRPDRLEAAWGLGPEETWAAAPPSPAPRHETGSHQ